MAPGASSAPFDATPVRLKIGGAGTHATGRVTDAAFACQVTSGRISMSDARTSSSRSMLSHHSVNLERTADATLRSGAEMTRRTLALRGCVSIAHSFLAGRGRRGRGRRGVYAQHC